MSYTFRLPDIGEGVAEGEVVEWFVKEGDSIKEDAPLVSVLTDKANVEIPSPKSGRVAKIHARVGEKVKVGGELVTFDDGSDPPTAGTDPSPPMAPPPSSPGGEPSEPAVSAPSVAPPGSAGPAPGRVLASPFVRRLAAERGIDLSRVTGSGPGGRIVEADLGMATPPGPAATARGAEAPRSTAVDDRLPEPPAPSASSSAAPAPPPPPPPPAPPDASVERIPIRGIRRVIAEHMSEATHRAAHFTYVEEVDASELVRFRERTAKSVEKHGVKLSFLPFIVKAVIAGLRAQPRMNSTVDDARQEIVLHKEFHIGIATAAPDGLIVPVIRDADKKSIRVLAKEIQELSERGRAGKLTRGELAGSTFTITSLGALGGVLATPILNYPEVGILGVHKIVRRPIYLPDGSVGPADLMNLSVSLDHRVLDGIVGAQFLSVVKANLEDPHELLADLA